MKITRCFILYFFSYVLFLHIYIIQCKTHQFQGIDLSLTGGYCDKLSKFKNLPLSTYIKSHATMNIGVALYVAIFIMNVTLACLLGYLFLQKETHTKKIRPSIRNRVLIEVVSSLTLHLVKEVLTFMKPPSISIDTVAEP
jgi:hypothetical protein